MRRTIPTIVAVAVLSIAVRGADAARHAHPREPAQEGMMGPRPPHSFVFTRSVYSGARFGWRRSSWDTDFPKADRQFLVVLRRVTNLDTQAGPHLVRLDDAERLRRLPFIYAVEVGHMSLSEAEVETLRGYLLAGGFLMVDDFWGTQEWSAFESNIRRVFPDRPIEEIPRDHPVFHTYYRIEELVQVPSVNNALRGRTWERDGYEPHLRGIFDDAGRLMVAINWNTDLGDAWEWADIPEYPLEYSTFAYQMAVNLIVYAMSH